MVDSKAVVKLVVAIADNDAVSEHYYASFISLALQYSRKINDSTTTSADARTMIFNV